MYDNNALNPKYSLSTLFIELSYKSNITCGRLIAAPKYSTTAWLPVWYCLNKKI